MSITNNVTKVLIVEDDRDINELLCDHLALQGYSVSSSHNGLKAKELIQNEDYDLFLLDWMLPDMNGMEVCKFIRLNDKTKKKPI